MSTRELPKLSPAQRQVAAVLAEMHDATILQITALAGVSKSTVTKALALLESAEAAARTIHADGDVRLADTWSPTPLTGRLLIGSGPCDDPGDEPGLELLLAVADEPSVAVEAASVEVLVEEETDFGVTGEPGSGLPAVVVPEAGAEVGVAVERLPSGGLASLVAALIADNPFNEYTPTMLSHLLHDRSSGAISNLCGSSEDGAPRPRRAKGELRATVAEVLSVRPGVELSPVEIANLLGASAGAVANALDPAGVRGVCGLDV
jgi:hypothetical protein